MSPMMRYLTTMNTLCRMHMEHNGARLPAAFRSVPLLHLQNMVVSDTCLICFSAYIPLVLIGLVLDYSVHPKNPSKSRPPSGAGPNLWSIL